MGQIGSAMGDENTFDADPQGLSPTEWAVRLAGGAGKGLLQGLQNRNQMRPPQGGQMMPVPMPQQPQVQLPGAMDPQQNPQQKNKLFFGQ